MSGQFNVENILQNTQIFLQPHVADALRIETERLLIRPVTEQDVAFYQDKLWGDPQVMQYFGNGQVRLYKDETSRLAGQVDYARYRIVDSENSWLQRWKNNNPYSGMTVCLKSTGEPIGHVVVGGGELAFMFKPEAWKNRYATEAVTAYIRKVIPTLVLSGYPIGVDKIVATCSADNIASQCVMERAGLAPKPSAIQKDFSGKICEKLALEREVATLIAEHQAREMIHNTAHPLLTHFDAPEESGLKTHSGEKISVAPKNVI